MYARLRKTTLVLAVLALGLVAAVRPAEALIGDAGTFYLQPEAGVYGAGQDSVNVIATFGGSFGYFVIDGLSVGAEALYYMINQRDTRDDVYHWAGGRNEYHGDINGFGFNALVRYYPVRTDSAAFFIGTGLGGLFTDKRMPSWQGDKEGFYDHLTLPVDVGVVVNFTQNFGLELTGRYQRIGFQDPGVDAFGGHLALRFTF